MSCYVTRQLAVARPGNDLFHQQRVRSCLPNPSSRRHARFSSSSHPQHHPLSVPIPSPTLHPLCLFPASFQIAYDLSLPVLHHSSSILKSHVLSLKLTQQETRSSVSSPPQPQTPNTHTNLLQTPPPSSKWPEPNVSPARRSTQDHPHTPLKTRAPARAKPRRQKTTTANRVPASK